MDIKNYGWDEHFAKEWRENSTEGMYPARIIADYGQKLRVMTETGELLISRPLKKLDESGQLAVGDWLALEHSPETQAACVRLVLARKTKFSRAAAGIEVKEQIVAANIDTVFLVQSLNRDFNLKRLERYLIAAWESGALPVVVLTKADGCANVAERVADARVASPGVEVQAVSCVSGEGIAELRKYFATGKTVALLGSSGVGKSTLVNTLAGKELLKTQAVRENDSRGRHTTTHRELVLLPAGGLILDTPGMRSLALWEADAGMEVMFGDVEELTKQCRFSDCHHGNEPGCAVREALAGGKLERNRWESWLKLQKERAFLEAKQEGKLRFQEKQWGKQIAKFQRHLGKH
ncbi:ribosome small subunit-dependent GTPase A [Desulfosporosinus sp. PR]|uniref:ribosome small subunit-dependent GTPase A n=1 Tax=Candidatus Desulfosporosinus nitrosoreducens TaxID=3401928 RepID=UPI0027EE8962|nr:ribosome small subunit-dependent GTPase A [Desulfosporosinus sp. PR]MDQ7094692.1 ribosome small subunit-dependent GTPase A [Desulfosporosinus sp. PR]